MSFKVKIVLTGICMFSLKKTWDDTWKKGDAINVYLPDGGGVEDPPRLAKAKPHGSTTFLNRHAAFINMNACDVLEAPLWQEAQALPDPARNRLVEARKAATRLVRYLKKETITFEPTFEKASAVDKLIPDSRRLLRGVVPLKRVLGANWDTLDPLLTDPEAKPLKHEELRALVVLDRGGLTTERLEEEVLWDLETLDGKRSCRPIAHRVVLTLEGVTKFIVNSTDIDDNLVFSLPLAPGMNNEIVLTIGNLCGRCNPLEWGPEDQVAIGGDDEDFRLHYQLLSEPLLQDICDIVTATKLPYPRRPSTGAQSAGSGVNCFPGSSGP